MEIFATKRLRGHSSQYVQNCEHSDLLNLSASISFASTTEQQYVQCEIRSVIRFFFFGTVYKTPIKICREHEFVYGECLMNKDNVRKEEWIYMIKQEVDGPQF